MALCFILGAFLLALTNGFAEAGRKPKAPGNFRITDATESSFVLEWEKPSDEGDAPLTGYGIFYEFKCRDPFGCVSSTVTIENPEANTYTIQRLPQIKKYTAFFIVAINDYGWSYLAKFKVKKFVKKTTVPTTVLPTTVAITTSGKEETVATTITEATQAPTTGKETGFADIPLETKAPENTTSAPTKAKEEPTTEGILTTLPPKGTTCNSSLGVESEWIDDENFAASSSDSEKTMYYHARLNNPDTSWVANIQDPGPWWQVQLKEIAVATGIAIQGHPKMDYWITKLKLEFSRDNVEWYPIGTDEQYDGSNDRNTVVYIEFDPIYLKSIMVYALKVNNRAAIRAEVYGCEHSMPTCGIRPSETMRRYRRIVGGTESRESSWPWVGAMQYEGETFCSATLISDNWAVTAAHCFSEKNKRSKLEGWKVVFGKHSLSKSTEHQKTRLISALYMHPNHERFYELIKQELRYDIALFRLNSKVPLDEKIKPICEINPTVDFGVGASCYTVGWGKTTADGTQSDVLRQVNYNIVDGNKCTGNVNEELTEDFICAGSDEGGKGSCEFDGGNGVYCEKDGYFYLVGIVSKEGDCSSDHKYEKLTNMKFMRSFLKEKKKTTPP